MNDFLNHIKTGLSQNPKKLSSTYFYDEEGDYIFQQIMKMPSYYLPKSEMDIIHSKSFKIAKKISETHEKLQIIEFGSGDGSKTKYLLKHFLSHFRDLEFIALDISESVLSLNQMQIQSQNPNLNYHNIAGDYFETFKRVEKRENTGKLVLLMGANIGNYTLEQSYSLLNFIRENLNPEDFVLISFDLVKDPRRIIAAYDDKEGITKAFNLNLLKRINRVFGANFNLDKFDHFPYYDPITGIAHSQLVSLENQQVFIPGAGSFDFKIFESIHTEISKKYWLSDIEETANKTQFKLIQNYFDQNKDYVFSLLQV